MTAVAALITAVTGLLLALNQIGYFGGTGGEAPTSASASPSGKSAAKELSQPEAAGTTGGPAGEAASRTSDLSSPGFSTNIDEPVLLTSDQLRGRGVGEAVSYYYTFWAGPGTVRVVVDGQNQLASLASAVDVRVQTLDADPLVRINLGNTTVDARKVESFETFRRQQLVLRVLLHPATIHWAVRLEGAVELSDR